MHEQCRLYPSFYTEHTTGGAAPPRPGRLPARWLCVARPRGRTILRMDEIAGIIDAPETSGILEDCLKQAWTLLSSSAWHVVSSARGRRGYSLVQSRLMHRVASARALPKAAELPQMLARTLRSRPGFASAVYGSQAPYDTRRRSAALATTCQNPNSASCPHSHLNPGAPLMQH